MNPYHLAWILWVAAFFCIEVPALVFHRNQGMTLSECVWKVFAITGKDHKFWRIRRVLLIAFLGWLSLHFLTGGQF